MAKIARKTQKIFAGSAINNGQFGSAQVGTKLTSTDIAVLQALGAYSTGWLDAIIGASKFPTLEEFQALSYIETSQIAYLLQEGIPEYDAGTNYFQHSIVKQAGTYQLYGSLTDNNLGNALTDATKWVALIDLSAAGGLALLKANNLSDLASLPTALTNLGFNTGHIGSSPGYYQLPGGLIKQFGSSSNTGISTAVVFPLTFPTNLYGIQITVLSGDLTLTNSNSFGSFFAPTTSGFSWGSVNLGGINSTPGSVTMHWEAIGD